MTIELQNIDCMEFMRTQPDKAFDLAVVDPPYGIGDFSMFSRKGKEGKYQTKWKYDWNNDIPNENYFNEIRRISVHQFIWGCNYFNQFPKNGGAVVWFKNNLHPNMSKCEIASTTQHKRVEYIHINWSNTDKFNSLAGASIHPCQKPVGLYDWIYRNYAKPGQRIFDSHLGSGSSAIAAHYYGVDFVGCEIDEHYFKLAKERIDQETRQIAMF